MLGVSGTLTSPISTIFIIGFPDDFKERELNNMFLFAPGFEGAALKTTNITNFEDFQHKQLIAFAKFSKPSEAIYALEILNGRILDLERGLVLKAEIAKKNLIIKSSVGSNIKSANNNISDKENTIKQAIPSEPSIVDVNINSEKVDSHMSTLNSSSCIDSNTLIDTFSSPNLAIKDDLDRFMRITLPGQSNPLIISVPLSSKEESESKQCDFNFKDRFGSVINKTKTTLLPSSKVKVIPILQTVSFPSTAIKSEKSLDPDLLILQNRLLKSPDLGKMSVEVGENFPCNTLYVGNLPSDASEDELRTLFRNSLGFRRLSFRPKGKGPMCFVEFDDIACATVAMETLYGTPISSSTNSHSGIRLSFSKNPLGLRISSTQSIADIKNYFKEIINSDININPEHLKAIFTIFKHHFKLKPNNFLSKDQDQKNN